MSVAYTDAWGSVLDTGSSTQPTARTNTETEFHTASEKDTGSGLTISTGTTVGSGIPHFYAHRPASSIR